MAKDPIKLNNGANWEDLIKPVLLAWLGITIYMEIKVLPQTRSYWDNHAFFGCPLIRAIMKRDRFEQILRNIHLVDNETIVTDNKSPEYDKLAKVKWHFEDFVMVSQSIYNCERHFIVDEIMIVYFGTYCNFI